MSKPVSDPTRPRTETAPAGAGTDTAHARDGIPHAMRKARDTDPEAESKGHPTSDRERMETAGTRQKKP